jgi:hypothetical protein
MINELPFDLRHNRIISYASRNFTNLKEDLVRSLSYIKEILTEDVHPKIDDHLVDLSSGNEDPSKILRKLIDQVGQEFGFTNPKLESQEPIAKGGFFVKIRDSFGNAAGFVVDTNGIIREKKKVKD